MTIEELTAVLPVIAEGSLSEVMEKLSGHPELSAESVKAIRRVLGVKPPRFNSILAEKYGDDIVREYQEDGISIRQLARRYDSYKGAIHTILRRANAVKSDSEFWTSFKTKKVEVLMKEGKSAMEIANLVGTSWQFVNRKMKELRAAEKEKTRT